MGVRIMRPLSWFFILFMCITPMALSLGYGILFATPLTLVLIPCLYMIGNDIRRLLRIKEAGR